MISKDITAILQSINNDTSSHIPNTNKFERLSNEINEIAEDLFSNNNSGSFSLCKNNGNINILFPYKQLGTISSKNFFNLNELIFSSYYILSNNNYKKFADIGACLGFHGIIFSKYHSNLVNFFEPDPNTYEMLCEYIMLNELKNYNCYNRAVYSNEGNITFNRLDENNTGSHIEGSKDNVYGSVSKINVSTISFDSILKEKYDLIKLDIEGAELEVFKNLNLFNNEKFPDTYIEIHNKQAAEVIYEVLVNKLKLNIFSQNLGWSKLTNKNDMPYHYSHGSIMVSNKNYMNWGM